MERGWPSSNFGRLEESVFLSSIEKGNTRIEAFVEIELVVREKFQRRRLNEEFHIDRVAGRRSQVEVVDVDSVPVLIGGRGENSETELKDRYLPD